MGRTVTPPAFATPDEIDDLKVLGQECEARFILAMRSADRSCASLFKNLDEWQRSSAWHRLAKDWDEFCLKYTGKPASVIAAAAEGLRLLGNDVPFNVAVSKSEEVRLRSIESKRLVSEEGMTQAQAAAELEVDQRTVGRDLGRNSGYPLKVPKRHRVQLLITTSTKPETAAQKILEKFGQEFAESLKSFL